MSHNNGLCLPASSILAALSFIVLVEPSRAAIEYIDVRAMTYVWATGTYTSVATGKTIWETNGYSLIVDEPGSYSGSYSAQSPLPGPDVGEITGTVNAAGTWDINFGDYGIYAHFEVSGSVLEYPESLGYFTSEYYLLTHFRVTNADIYTVTLEQAHLGGFSDVMFFERGYDGTFLWLHTGKGTFDIPLVPGKLYGLYGEHYGTGFDPYEGSTSGLMHLSVVPESSSAVLLGTMFAALISGVSVKVLRRYSHRIRE